VPTLGFFVFLPWDRNETYSADLFPGIAVFVVFLILAPAYLLHRMAGKYAVWKKWAKERGWEEEKNTAPPR